MSAEVAEKEPLGSLLHTHSNERIGGKNSKSKYS